MAGSPEHAYATLLMTDSYLPGAMVLGHSLKDGGTSKQLIALITPETISASTIDELKNVYDQVIPIAQVRNNSPGNLYLMGREDLASTFSKIGLWSLTQFKRLVYIDADVVALRAPDELFDLKSNFAAVPDVGWPDIFNSGVMALTPNLQDYHALQSLATNGVSFDGADQGLLNMHFSRNLWERLSFTYNCTPSGNYQYAPAYRHFGSQISLIHFIGRQKPWQMGRNVSGFSSVYRELMARWWAVYDKYYGLSTYTVPFNQAPASQQPTTHTPARESVIQMHVHSDSAFRKPSIPTSSNAESRWHQPSQPEHTWQQEVPIMVVHPPSEDPPQSFELERRFSAPRVEWDATRAPPPAQSHPEAVNFPDNVYEMSKDTEFFKPPTAYPAPPTDMYYEVPKEKPKVHERPKVIFPWEVNQRPASRVFPDEPPLPPVPDPDHQPAPLPTLDTSGTEILPNTTGTPSVGPDPVLPSSIANAGISSQNFGSYSRTNAWDMIPSIQRYAEAWRNRRKVMTIGSALSSSSITQRKEGGNRRPSLILTDFPTEVERPSLPVTPAPIRAGSVFWGRGQSTEDLPHAEGVPSPEAWNPGARLEELQRRQSEVFLAGPVFSKSLPSREQISSAIAAAIEEDPENRQLHSKAMVSPGETPSLLSTVSGEDSESQQPNSKVKGLPLLGEVPSATLATTQRDLKFKEANSKTLPLLETRCGIDSAVYEADSGSQQRDSETPLLREEIFNATRATTTEEAGTKQKSSKVSTVVHVPSLVKNANSEAPTTDMEESISPLTEEIAR